MVEADLQVAAGGGGQEGVGGAQFFFRFSAPLRVPPQLNECDAGDDGENQNQRRRQKR